MNTSHQAADLLLLSELALQTPRFATNLATQFSPTLSQGETPSRMNALSSTNATGNSGATDVGADLLNDQCATTNDADLLGDLIPMPSPRQTTQSPETHPLQQTLQSNASEQAHMYNSPSNSNDGASCQTYQTTPIQCMPLVSAI